MQRQGYTSSLKDTQNRSLNINETDWEYFIRFSNSSSSRNYYLIYVLKRTLVWHTSQRKCSLFRHIELRAMC